MIYYFIFSVGSDLSVFKIFKDEAESIDSLPSRVLSILRTKYFELFNSYIIDKVKVNIPNSKVNIVGYFDEKFNYTNLLIFDNLNFLFDSIYNFKNLDNSFVKKELKRSKAVNAKSNV